MIFGVYWGSGGGWAESGWGWLWFSVIWRSICGWGWSRPWDYSILVWVLGGWLVLFVVRWLTICVWVRRWSWVLLDVVLRCCWISCIWVIFVGLWVYWCSCPRGNDCYFCCFGWRSFDCFWWFLRVRVHRGWFPGCWLSFCTLYDCWYRWLRVSSCYYFFWGVGIWVVLCWVWWVCSWGRSVLGFFFFCWVWLRVVLSF